MTWTGQLSVGCFDFGLVLRFLCLLCFMKLVMIECCFVSLIGLRNVVFLFCVLFVIVSCFRSPASLSRLANLAGSCFGAQINCVLFMLLDVCEQHMTHGTLFAGYKLSYWICYLMLCVFVYC